MEFVLAFSISFNRVLIKCFTKRCRLWDILQGNGYALSAKAGSYFIVHSRVLFSFARMTKTNYSPVLHASAGNLRVTSQNVKGHLRLRSVKFRYKIQQSFSNSYALIIRQNNKPAYPIVSHFHSYVDNGDERYRSVLVECGVTSCG
jgi:hypothetical protein